MFYNFPSQISFFWTPLGSNWMFSHENIHLSIYTSSILRDYIIRWSLIVLTLFVMRIGNDRWMGSLSSTWVSRDRSYFKVRWSHGKFESSSQTPNKTNGVSWIDGSDIKCTTHTMTCKLPNHLDVESTFIAINPRWGKEFPVFHAQFKLMIVTE